MCCCVSDDRKCDYKGGDCKMTKKGCKGGYWTTGDCAGPADRKCCIQDGMLLFIYICSRNVSLDPKDLNQKLGVHP